MRRPGSARRPHACSPPGAGTASSSPAAKTGCAALAEETGGEAEPCDIGDRAAVEALAARILERHPSIHALVNNAGMPARRQFPDVELDLVEEVARVNYLGGVWVTRGLLPGLRPASRRARERTSST